jgi:hypothetical protein
VNAPSFDQGPADRSLDRVPATMCPTKPDWDNVGKAVSDALQKAGIIRDHAQVCDSYVVKLYAARDEGLRVEVRLERIAVAQAECMTAGPDPLNVGSELTWPTPSL